MVKGFKLLWPFVGRREGLADRRGTTRNVQNATDSRSQPIGRKCPLSRTLRQNWSGDRRGCRESQHRRPAFLWCSPL